jgi:uncharacterized protein (DUF302 family)
MAVSHELSVSAVVLSIAIAAAVASAADPQPFGTAVTTPQPPVTTGAPLTPNTMMRPIPREARDRLMRDTLAQSSLLLRDLINLMAHKVEAQPGLSFDEVVDSIKNRANKLNLKFVGANPLSKEVAAVTGKPTPRVEIFSFCDALLAREMLDYSLEFVIFMPCRIAVVEDAQQKIWLVMMDWNPDWLESTNKPIPDTLRDGARRLRQKVENMIQAGASGAL